jgi:hypothetical protein
MRFFSAFMRVFAISFSLFSCQDWSKANFEITNTTSTTLDSVFIEPNRFTKGKFVPLAPGQTIKYVCDMGKGGGPDGAYVLSYIEDSIKKRKIFGYYSNGNSLEKLTKLEIKPDTIIIQPLD